MEVPPYAPYEREKSGYTSGLLGMAVNKQNLFKRYNNEDEEVTDGSFFRYVDRVRLVFDMITQRIDTSELVNWGIIESDFPLHDHKKIENFRNTFGTWKAAFKRVQLHKLRNYFGEDVALYFAYLVKYLIWLIVPTVIGIIVFILKETIGGHRDDMTHYTAGDFLIFCYSFIIACSATAYDQYWIRREQRYALEWGMIGFTQAEFQRPEYNGTRGKDPITGQIKKLDNRSKAV